MSQSSRIQWCEVCPLDSLCNNKSRQIHTHIIKLNGYFSIANIISHSYQFMYNWVPTCIISSYRAYITESKWLLTFHLHIDWLDYKNLIVNFIGKINWHYNCDENNNQLTCYWCCYVIIDINFLFLLSFRYLN